MDLIVDFNGYNLPDGNFAIKEYSFCSLFPDINGNYYAAHNIVTPPLLNKSYNQEEYKKCYEPYYETYGIPWNSGVTNYSFMNTILRLHLREANTIYLRNLFMKNLITNLCEDEFNVICLYDYGYEFNPPMNTNCHYHENPDRNNCANDNTINMMNWLQNTQFYLPETRNNFINLKNKFLGFNQMEYKSADETSEHPRSKKRKLNEFI
ncbi:uncharacterized protein LOC123272993 [Cotesia glomerata]|uniref:uncharacterized protein LOC123272993 n=1 Tax=Cotesia glomerata TaxID=32391 RepID=UPI001D011198|nr:uncharacterized protein LOC123272993 [Cotesia glomerata]